MKIKPEELRDKRIILASKSPRRKELLSLICDSFEIMPADIDETVPCEIGTACAAEYTAKRKAEAIAADGVVIACDTVVIIDGEILGKPTDRQNGFDMLKKLSGREHSVVSGVALRYKNVFSGFSQESKVKFLPLSDEEINDYLDSGEPFDKAGGYGIQGIGGVLIDSFEGDFFNIVGLPVARLRKELVALIEQAED